MSCEFNIIYYLLRSVRRITGITNENQLGSESLIQEYLKTSA